MKKKLSIYIFFTKIVCIILSVSCNFAPGSYSDSEDYILEIKENLLIKEIQDFKLNNPEYQVPEQVDLKDGRSDTSDLWYHCYFYIKDENIIIYAWTRPKEIEKTTFAFIAVNQGLILGNWKEINNDLNSAENVRMKKLFEQRILNPIKSRKL